MRAKARIYCSCRLRAARFFGILVGEQIFSADIVGRLHSYKDYNITLWIMPKGDTWEFASVVSGPINSGTYSTVTVDGVSPMPTEEEAYERAYNAAIKHIDHLA